MPEHCSERCGHGNLLPTTTLRFTDDMLSVLLICYTMQVDVLFTDETFRLAPIGAQAPDGAQFLFVTATLPQEVRIINY
jgi:hypothetical protein